MWLQQLTIIFIRRRYVSVSFFMSRLTPNDRDKLTKLMGELNKRNGNHSISSSTSSSILSSISSSFTLSSYSSPLSTHSSSIMANTNGSDTSSRVDSDGDTNVIGDNSNQKYDDNSTLFNAVRDSESAQQIDLNYSYNSYPPEDAVWEFPASVEITYEPSKAERLAHAIFYGIATDNVTWIWLAMYLLTSM